MEYFNPVEIIFGSQVRDKIVDECIGKSVLIVCSSTAFNRYRKDCKLKYLLGHENFLFEHGFESNPSLTDIVKISHKYQDKSFDLIIGLGGGITGDVAGFVAQLNCAREATNEMPQKEYDVGMCQKFVSHLRMRMIARLQQLAMMNGYPTDIEGLDIKSILSLLKGKHDGKMDVYDFATDVATAMQPLNQ